MATVFLLIFTAALVFTAFMAYKIYDEWQRAAGQDLLVELDGELQELQELAVTKARLLGDIKDLEFDHQTGHVSIADYQDMRRKMEAQAIHVLKRLDELRGDTDYDAIIDEEYELRFGDGDEPQPRKKKRVRPQSKAAGQSADGAKRKRKRKATAGDEGADSSARKRRKKRPQADSAKDSPAAPSKTQKKRPAKAAAKPQAVASLFCSSCGTELEADSRFCHACGAAVKAPKAASNQVAAVETAAAGR